MLRILAVIGAAALGWMAATPSETSVTPGTIGTIESEGQNESFERDQIQAKVAKAMMENDFKTLNAMEAEFQTRRSLTPSGVWKLGVYYDSMQFAFEPDPDCISQNEEFLDHWRAAYPTSPGPVIAKAAALADKAWCIRGGSFAYKVSRSAMDSFGNILSEANDLLDDAKDTVSQDPEFYAVKARVLLGLNTDRDEYMALLNEGLDREPYYFPIYYEGYSYFMPQWHGSWNELSAFAHSAVSRTSKRLGSEAYVRFYWHLTKCNCQTAYDTKNWPKMKDGMAEMYARYPTNWNASAFTMLSCKEQDWATAKLYAEKVGDAPSGVDLSEFESCRASIAQMG